MKEGRTAEENAGARTGRGGRGTSLQERVMQQIDQTTIDGESQIAIRNRRILHEKHVAKYSISCSKYKMID